MRQGLRHRWSQPFGQSLAMTRFGLWTLQKASKKHQDTVLRSFFLALSRISHAFRMAWCNVARPDGFRQPWGREGLSLRHLSHGKGACPCREEGADRAGNLHTLHQHLTSYIPSKNCRSANLLSFKKRNIQSHV